MSDRSHITLFISDIGTRRLIITMIKRTRSMTGRRNATIACLLIGIVLVGTACNSSSPSPTASSGAQATSIATTTPAGDAGASKTVTPQGNDKSGKLDCQAIANAAFDLNSYEPALVVIVNAGGSVLNRADSPMYVDTAKMRADLDVLAALPDPTDATEISIMGKPSEAISQFRQILDLIDKDANADPATTGTPPVDISSGGVSDPQLSDFAAQFIKMSTAINAAVGDACPNTSPDAAQAGLPTAQSTPLAAGYGIGQTAPVGDLRVTLDKVVALPGVDALRPTPGNRFVFVYFTVENMGKDTFQVNTLTGTHWEDAAGKQYFFDPDTIMLDPNTTNFDGGIQPGAKQSGAVGYMLPVDMGNMVWVFEDFKPNQAVFTVKASDIAQ